MERLVSAIGELLGRLTPFGLEPDVATVYSALWAEGRCDAATVAERAELSKPRTDRALGTLVQLGFATKSLQRPLQYDAVPPETVMSLMRSALQEKDRELARVEEDFVRRMRDLRDGSGAGNARPSFAVIQGREAVIDRFAEMARQAKVSIEFLSSHRNPAIFERIQRVFDTLWERARAGVQVRLLLGGAGQKPILKALKDTPGLAIRHGVTDGIAGILIVDGSKTVQLAHADPTGRMSSKSSVAIVAEAPLLVAGHLALFNEAWAQASQTPPDAP